MATVTIYDWTGHTWAGWWKDDQEVPLKLKGVELRQMDNSKIYQGMTMSFDVPNGDDWNEHEKGVNRWVMEGVKVDFYSGDYTLEGFVRIEPYGKEALKSKESDLNYRKQRWVVTKK